jgi:hypothetical protein
MDVGARLKAAIRGVRPDVLLFDLAVGFAAVALPGIFLPGDEELAGVAPGGAALLTVLVVFLVVFQMGGVHRRLTEGAPAFLRVVGGLAITLGTTGLYIGLLVFLVLFDLLPFTAAIGSEAGFLSCLLLSLAALWGFAAGFPASAAEPGRTRGRTSKKKRDPTAALLFVPLTMLLPSLIIGALVTGHGAGWHWGLLVLLGGAAATVAPYVLIDRRDRWTAPRALRRVAPVAAAVAGAAALLLWERLFVLAIRQASINNFGVVDRDFVFWWAVAAGLVPFRAIVLLAPPYSVLHGLVAAASFATYLQALYEAI